MKFDRVVLEEKASILKLISHPVRLCILRGLSDEGEKNVSYIQGCLDVPQSTLSQHLAKLRAQGLVAFRRDGQTLFYRIDDWRALRLLETLHALFCAPATGGDQAALPSTASPKKQPE